MHKKFGKNVAKTMRSELKKKGPEGLWFKKSKDHPEIKAESTYVVTVMFLVYRPFN